MGGKGGARRLERQAGRRSGREGGGTGAQGAGDHGRDVRGPGTGVSRSAPGSLSVPKTLRSQRAQRSKKFEISIGIENFERE